LLSPSQLPTIKLNHWENIFATSHKEQLAKLLTSYLTRRSWLEGQPERIRSTELTESLAIPDSDTRLLNLRVDYRQGDPVTYMLLVSYAVGEEALHLIGENSPMLVAQLALSGEEEKAADMSEAQGVERAAERVEKGVLYDAIADPDFLKTILETIISSGAYEGSAGKLRAQLLRPESSHNLPTHAVPLAGDYNNSSVVYDDDELGNNTSLILKFFRKLEPGINPDLEIRSFLSRHQQFKNFNNVVGYLSYQRNDQRSQSGSATVGVLQEYLPGAQRTWEYTLDNIRSYFDQVAVEFPEMTESPPVLEPLLTLQAEFDEDTEEKRLASHLMGPYLANIKLLGQRTAEFHIALTADPTDAAFAPEPFSGFYQRSIYQFNRNLTGQVFRHLRDDLKAPNGMLSDELKPLASSVLEYQEVYLERFSQMLECKITAERTRYHGDYHLGQVLYTGKDFILIDFEGEDNRTVSERRIKRSPLQDVAYMLQSIHYATINGFRNEIESGTIRPEQADHIEQWAQFWEAWVSAAFLSGYLKTAHTANFLPKTQQELRVLLNDYLLSRTIHDVGYKLTHGSNEID